MRLALRGPGADTSSASRPNFCFNTVSISFLSSLAGGMAITILPSFFAASRILSHSAERFASAARASVLQTKVTARMPLKEKYFLSIFRLHLSEHRLKALLTTWNGRSKRDESGPHSQVWHQQNDAAQGLA